MGIVHFLRLFYSFFILQNFKRADLSAAAASLGHPKPSGGTRDDFLSRQRCWVDPSAFLIIPAGFLGHANAWEVPKISPWARPWLRSQV